MSDVAETLQLPIGPLRGNDDALLSMSDDDVWRVKADYCKYLYGKGLEHLPWSKERAEWWYKSLTFFVEEFIQPRHPIPAFHQDWYYWRVLERAYMNLAPREHAKTSVHAVYSSLWEVCCNRNIRFFIVFSTESVAKLVLSEIKGHLTKNTRILAGFGIFNPMDLLPEERLADQDWSQHSITVNRPDYSLKDPTVAVTGALTNVLSRRCDRLIVDDLLTDKIAYSEAESGRLVSWYYNDVLPTLVAEGQEIICGTPYRRGDFYDEIKKQSKDEGGLYQIFIGDAIVDEYRKKTLWPEVWSWAGLERQRAKMGYVRFNRNYRCRIVSDEDSPFPMIWFEGGTDERTRIVYRGCYEPAMRLGIGPATTTGRKWLRYITMGVDPAIGDTKSSKFVGMVVLGIDYQGQVVVADMARGQYNFVQQKRLVFELYRQWKPRYIVVESNAYQKALVEGLMEEDPYLPVVPYYTSGQKQKPDIGVPAMDVFFETGRVRIPRGNQHSMDLTDILCEELHFWGRHNTSDLAMAFWFAFQRLQPELERMGAMPSVENLIFGDRARYENQLVSGMSGLALPRRTMDSVRNMALYGPLAHLSPVRNKGRPVLHGNKRRDDVL